MPLGGSYASLNTRRSSSDKALQLVASVIMSGAEGSIKDVSEPGQIRQAKAEKQRQCALERRNAKADKQRQRALEEALLAKAKESSPSSIDDGSHESSSKMRPPPNMRANATASPMKGVESEGRWTFDEETHSYIVQCPTCGQPHLIPEADLKCCQFSCGANARTGQPLKPHMKKRERDLLRERGCIVGGCGGRFKFNPRKKELSVLD